MKNTFVPVALAIPLAAALASACSSKPPEQAAPDPAIAAAKSQLAADAYTFAYPLVTMEMTRRVMTSGMREATRFPRPRLL
jgi:hypothetical protein